MIDPVVVGRPEAAAEMLKPIARGPDASALRRSGVLRALVAGVFSGALFFFGHVIAAGVAASLGVLTLLLALLSPTGGYLALSRAVDKLGEAVGAVLTWLLLAPVFYLFFTPFGLSARRGKGDRVGRRFDRSAASYWLARPSKSDEESRASLERPY